MILLDTHVLVWWEAGGDRLSARARREVAGTDEVLVSLVLLLGRWRSSRRRAGSPSTGMSSLGCAISTRTTGSSRRRCRRRPATGAGLLPERAFGGDPADAFLYAQARDLVAPLVTKDPRIREFARSTGEVRTIW